jgi:poly-gamma-glutamate capsule biosynthesis protein CapA/YwtB (metallophosphatase superfamily)
VISLPDGTAGKVLALIIGVAMLGAIHVTAVAPLFSYYESTAKRLQDRQELARRYQNLAGELPRLRAAETQSQNQPSDGGLLLTGATDAVAAAMLQSALKDLAERERTKLTSSEMLPREPGSDVVRRVGVRITFSANLKLLMAVIEGIDSTHPVLSIGNLDIHGAGASKAGDEDRALAVAMDVYGFVPQ